MLSSVATFVETLGIQSTQKKENVTSVEQYSNLLLEDLATVVQSAEISKIKKQLEETLKKYVLCAERHSQVLKDKLAVEKNAQEIEKMNLNVSIEKIKKIWVTSPEATYNFEVDALHNYQVHNGIVVHNCIDVLNQLSEMEKYTPGIDAPEHFFDGHNKSKVWEDFDADEGEYTGNGSTVF